MATTMPNAAKSWAIRSLGHAVDADALLAEEGLAEVQARDLRLQHRRHGTADDLAIATASAAKFNANPPMLFAVAAPHELIQIIDLRSGFLRRKCASGFCVNKRR